MGNKGRCEVSNGGAFTKAGMWFLVVAASVGFYGTPVVPFVSVMQVRSPCDARFNPGGHETARYLCLNERSGLMRPGKMRRLPGGDLLNFPKRTTRNTKQKGGNGGVSTHRTMCTWGGWGEPRTC